MAVHLVQRSRAYGACQENAASSDLVILVGEGVVAALTVARNCFASETDVHARALTAYMPDTVQLIDDEAIVEFCASNTPVVSWNQT